MFGKYVDWFELLAALAALSIFVYVQFRIIVAGDKEEITQIAGILAIVGLIAALLFIDHDGLR